MLAETPPFSIVNFYKRNFTLVYLAAGLLQSWRDLGDAAQKKSRGRRPAASKTRSV